MSEGTLGHSGCRPELGGLEMGRVNEKTLSGLWQVEPEGNSKAGKQCWWVSEIILVSCTFYFSKALRLNIALFSEAEAITLKIPSVFDALMSPIVGELGFIIFKICFNKFQVKAVFSYLEKNNIILLLILKTVWNSFCLSAEQAVCKIRSRCCAWSHGNA